MVTLPRAGFRLSQVLILALVVAGMASGEFVLVVNGLIGLGTTGLPWAIQRYGDVTISPPFVFWIAVAVLLHTLGMAGPYETIWWWDHLTHTLSAALLASVAYALTRTLEEHSTVISLPADFRFLFVVIFALAAGVLWEVLEFLGREGARWLGHQPVLVQYGLQDTVLDLLFDGAGAVIVGLLDRRWLGRSWVVRSWGEDGEDTANRKYS